MECCPTQEFYYASQEYESSSVRYGLTPLLGLLFHLLDIDR